MAIRSLVISLVVTFVLGYYFTIGLTEPNSFLTRIPDWGGLFLLIGCGLLYVVAALWAIKGFNEHKLPALVSLGFCVLGLGVYGLGFSLEMGSGKAAKGQYDYDFATLDPVEKATVIQIAQEAGLGLQNVIFTEHWHLADSTTNGFRICVQKGHVTALNVSNHPIQHLALFSQLPALGDLYLKNCGLSDMSGLQSAKLDRLEVSDNQITDLKTLRGCPNLRWLTAENNRLKSTDGVARFRQLVSSDFSGNPLP